MGRHSHVASISAERRRARIDEGVIGQGQPSRIDCDVTGLAVAERGRGDRTVIHIHVHGSEYRDGARFTGGVTPRQGTDRALSPADVPASDKNRVRRGHRD